MNRRDFLLRAAGVSVIPWVERVGAETSPCPPVSLSVAGGGSVTSVCGRDPADDWQSRISGPGVRWYHSFDTDDEVNLYTSASNRPQVSRIASGGVDGGGYLQCRPIDNGDDTFKYTQNFWKRPFKTDPYSAGYSTPGQNYTLGYYAHADYDDGLRVDGAEFWIQMAVLVPKERASFPYDGGKVIWLADLEGDTPKQEIVAAYRDTVGGDTAAPYQSNGRLQAYSNFGAIPLTSPHPTLTTYLQPGGEWNDTCTYNNPSSCWTWPAANGVDQWVTVLIHVIPGHAGVADTTIEFFVAEGGVYRKVISGVWALSFDASGPVNGWNALWCGCYYNSGSTPITDSRYFAQGFDQIIFSTEWVPPPNWTGVT